MNFFKRFKKDSKDSTANYKDAYYYNYYRRYLDVKDPISKSVGLVKIADVDARFATFHLESCEITSQITDSSSSTVISQEYKNNSKTPVEAIYQIPLPPYCTISQFQVTYDGKTYQGKIKEKTKAQEKYSDQIASGGQAMLAEKTAEGLFKLSIGNIPPTDNVSVSFTIISETCVHLDSFHYCLHRLLFPKNTFKLKFSLSVSLSTRIKKIQVDEYSAKIEYSADRKSGKVEFSSDFASSHIFVDIQPQNTEKPEYFIEKSESDNSYAVGINYYPHFKFPADEINQKSEFIFLLDCSGSMKGEPVLKAKRALDIIIRSLNENVKFNIYIFGTSYRKCFNVSSVMYNDETLEAANTFIDEIRATLGGTDLMPPVRDILTSPYDPNYPRQLFIFTDGDIENRDKLINYVARESNSTRIFTLGIGECVDKELVIGLSKACMGYYEFILNNNQIETQVLALLGVAMEPTLSNLRIEWNESELDLTQAPQMVRPLFNNERMMIYALIEKKLTESNQVDLLLRGNGPLGTEMTFPIKLDFSQATSTSNHLHSITALKIINDLEEEETKLSRGHFKRITELGKRYGLISKYTSYIITIDSDKPTGETMDVVRVLEEYTKPLAPKPATITYSPVQSPVRQIPQGSPTLTTNPLITMISESLSQRRTTDDDADCEVDDWSDSPTGSYSKMDSHGLGDELTELSILGEECSESLSKSSISKISASSGASIPMISSRMDTSSPDLFLSPPPPSQGACSPSPPPSVQSQNPNPVPGPSQPQPVRSFSSGKSSQLVSHTAVKSSQPVSHSALKYSQPVPLSEAKYSQPVSYSSNGSTAQKVSLVTERKEKPIQSTGDLLMDLIKSQKANGSWPINISTITQVPEVSGVKGVEKLTVEIWTALIVIATLKKESTNQQSIDLIIQKAIKWIKQELKQSNQQDSFDQYLKIATKSI